MVSWSGLDGAFSVAGEVLATADGLDRAGSVVRGRVELGTVAEVGGMLDVQLVEGGVGISDAAVRARLDPVDAVRVDLSWDAWSSLSYRVSAARDPLVRRFAVRSVELTGEPWTPQDHLDPTVIHQLRGVARLDLGSGLSVRTDLRYRGHQEAQRRRVWAGVSGQVTGLAGGRVDAGVGQAVVAWADHPAWVSTAEVFVELDRAGRLSVDATGEVVVQQHVGATSWGPAGYADVFVDAMLGDSLSASVGYAFSNAQDLERWDAWHGMFARLSWRVRTPRSEDGS